MSEIEKLSFEQAFAELDESVQKLEAGGLTLEEGLALFERGQSLAAHCSQQLDEAELGLFLLHRAAERVAVEGDHRSHVARADDDVVKAQDREGWVGGHGVNVGWGVRAGNWGRCGGHPSRLADARTSG